MAWHCMGDKPLSEPIMAQFIYAYICHSASMSELIGPYMCHKPMDQQRLKYMYSETCIKRPLNFAVSQGRWSFTAGKINMILLTLNVQGPSYLHLTRSILWLLMPWLLTSPGHQQPWYWLYRICRSLSYLREDFKYLCHINVDKWHKL